MVESGDRDKRSPCASLGQTPDSVQRAAHDPGRRLEDARERGCVAVVEVAEPARRLRDYPIDVVGAVKRLDLVASGGHRRDHHDPTVQSPSGHSRPEGLEAIGAEWMAVTETVSSKLIAVVDGDPD
jgi:hypothetical protein